MGKIRNQKLICLALMAALMISGICLDRVQASSSFSCKKESTISAPGYSIAEGSVYRTEQLNQREVIRSIRQARNNNRRVNSRTGQEIVSVSLDVDILPQKFHSFSATEERLYYETLCSVVILNYIHKQDGEKV